MFTLYLGSQQDASTISEDDRAIVLEELGRHFDSYTLTSGTGVFMGKKEEVMLIHIATNNPREIAVMAHKLRGDFEQEGVGVECVGRYFRATQTSGVLELTAQLEGALNRDAC